jgi:hypothetical protein
VTDYVSQRQQYLPVREKQPVVIISPSLIRRLIPRRDVITWNLWHGGRKQRLLDRPGYFEVMFQALHLAPGFCLAKSGVYLLSDLARKYPGYKASDDHRHCVAEYDLLG